MATKLTKSVEPPPGVRSASRKGGRPTSKRALEYAWFGDVEGFEHCSKTPWWEEIKWEEEANIKKMKGSVRPREVKRSVVHAGFLWEVIRRYPEFEKLMAGYARLQSLDGSGVKRDVEGDLDSLFSSANASGRFLEEQGLLVVESLDILAKHWKTNFWTLAEEVKTRWEACYLPLWMKVGKKGSVPATPAELPPLPPAQFSGQGLTAFDLLNAGPNSGLDGVLDYQDQPLPQMFLENFAKLRPSEGSRSDFLDPNSVFSKDVFEPDSYPWLSIGKLEKHLAKHQLHSLVLAVDLSKSTDIIFRDLRKIIEKKRESLGLCVADRRVRQESFDKIRDLDREVYKPDGKPPLSRTVREFENAAQLDLCNLLYSIDRHADCATSQESGRQVSIKETKRVLAELRKTSGNSP